jgi:hypothetical protein
MVYKRNILNPLQIANLNLRIKLADVKYNEIQKAVLNTFANTDI